jgi:formylglycine-generating enzyme required for sulfatase activity
MTDPMDITMVYVPAGKFLMGSTQKQVAETFEQAKQEYQDAKKEWYVDQIPQHERIIQQPFWLDLTPVTNQSYARFVAEGGYQTSEFWTPAGWQWVKYGKKIGPNDHQNFTDPQQPRVGVTWFEVYAYCCWRGGRLPTEAEWEWAARGPDNQTYPQGDTFASDYVVWDKNSGGKTALVDEGMRIKGSSWVGALDMSGNVCEWCSSLYKSYPFREKDGRESIDDTNSTRVLRGGSWWNSGTTTLRAAYRDWYYPSIGSIDIGFRFVRS